MAISPAGSTSISPSHVEAGNRVAFQSEPFSCQDAFTLGLNVIAQHGTAPGITGLPDLLEDHFGIPEIFIQPHIDVGNKGLKFG